MVRKPVARRIEELEARKRSLMARLAARERRLEVRRKMLLGTWMVSELRQSAEGSDVRMLRDLLRRQLPQMTLRDADRQLLEELLKEENADGNG
ncbi:mobilization protein [Agrobacterium tumefaciens]|uniref:mobilization protein n=1 Tax=Agrobacterium tumefaciens TaxID=358 RepID=UPI0011F15FFD|nr:mobilization protein [Agrobacterium tumefaciens]KAA1232729.1 mobilization protein [Agrobacterium tumefaciens]